MKSAEAIGAPLFDGNGWANTSLIQSEPLQRISSLNLQLIHSNRLNHELYSEPSFAAPQLYLLSHTLNRILSEHYTRCGGFKPTTDQDNYGFQAQTFTLQLVYN